MWSNLTMPAHFPYVAEAAACLYPQSGGSPIDGVIAIDPYVVEALMKYTGPIEVPELGVTVTPDNAARFILEDQYVLAGDDAQPDRVDALQTLGEEVIARLLAGSLPEPSELARDLGPLAAEHRLMVWTDDPEEQALLDDVEMLGALPQLGPEGGFSVVAANAGESKIDVFLERETEVRVETETDGTQRLIAEVTLTNNAPRAGLPDYVIGNSVGLPTGSSMLLVTFYGPPFSGRRTGERRGLALAPLTEAGWIGLRHGRRPGALANPSAIGWSSCCPSRCRRGHVSARVVPAARRSIGMNPSSASDDSRTRNDEARRLQSSPMSSAEDRSRSVQFAARELSNS